MFALPGIFRFSSSSALAHSVAHFSHPLRPQNQRIKAAYVCAGAVSGQKAAKNI